MSSTRNGTEAGADGYDVVVVGGGNAGFCAAHAAREQGARVLLLEKGAKGEDGGNSYYTAGAFRVAHGGPDDLADIVDDETRSLLPTTDLAPYTAADFAADMVRITEQRCDPAMTAVVTGDSAAAARWLHGKGVRWRLMYERQSYVSQGRHVFFGGLALGVVDGGKGLIEQHTRAAEDSGIEIRYGATVEEIVRDPDGAVRGVAYTGPDGRPHRVTARATVLAAGGFEANPELRRRHLGAGWENAVVRGNPLNTGEVLEMALGVGAAGHGDWSSCHSVAWDSGAPVGGGDRVYTNQHTRQSYPIGVVVDTDGRRFLDEGADYRNYTYAKYGKEILRRPGGRAFQLFDAKTRPLLRPQEYDTDSVTEVVADTVAELAARLGVDPDGLAATLDGFNAAIVDAPFDPAVKDGRAARVDPPKSNWAQPIDTAPFYGYPVSCGITFTFGGVHVDGDARVLTESGAPIPGLFAAGELVGGLFSGNYPGGSGLTAGAVYGRRAGTAAASQEP
ncbi:tricarballylate dehydrogenase [Murinocardiopsis flavida]|uniref:Tricarballylate dehydrogenase n=1 Tax=Murinocardiopsis flavida TaxID=645275 RepID=A0A2P8CLZ6_9ACTN|nr:FAD-dependent tricarballylate dehydrogenase TcuA [Murinocardiopsis flavida]PSK85943.1 tricarballylate dehydrogenase [Murinocardiopsis flavida]